MTNEEHIERFRRAFPCFITEEVAIGCESDLYRGVVSFISATLEAKDKEAQELYEALEMMYEQYCPEPFTHKCMTAGENAEEILDKYSRYKAPTKTDKTTEV